MDSEVSLDILYIYDGATQNSPILTQVSGENRLVPLLCSSGGAILMKFVSDKLKVNAGFFGSW